MRKIDPGLQKKLVSLISSMGYELVGCELVPQGRQAVFRIYIDSPTGVTVEDCSKVSYQVSAMMDVEDPIQGRYTLEVSSPGINRPLFELAHFERFIGSRAKVKLNMPVNQRKQYKGTIVRVEGETIILLADEVLIEIAIPFSSIDKANLIGAVHL